MGRADANDAAKHDLLQLHVIDVVPVTAEEPVRYDERTKLLKELRKWCESYPVSTGNGGPKNEHLHLRLLLAARSRKP